MASIKIYLPTSPDNAEHWCREVCATLVTTFGGATMYPAQGAWWSDTQGLVVEPVACIEAFESQPGQLDAALPALQALCAKLRVELNQECVAYAVCPGELTLVGWN
jgi:hypothetical protein